MTPIKCEYCGANNAGELECEKCGAPLPITYNTCYLEWAIGEAEMLRRRYGPHYNGIETVSSGSGYRSARNGLVSWRL
jgi:hypothetical protein